MELLRPQIRLSSRLACGTSCAGRARDFGALWVVVFLAVDASILSLAERLVGEGEQPELMRTMSTWAALAFYGLYLVGEFWRSVRAF